MTKVLEKEIEKLLNESEIEEHIFHNKAVVRAYKLTCGFVVIGVGACVDEKEFDIEIGRKYAREQAVNKLWELEGYMLQWSLADEQEKLYEDIDPNEDDD